MADGLTIAQVVPHPLGTDEEIGHHAERIAGELRGRGHAVITVAPSLSPADVRETRRAIRAAREEGAKPLLERARLEPVRLGVGEVLPFSGAHRRAASVPVDVARTIEEALSAIPFDVVHVHDPFAPSTSGAALRHSRGLNVGTFHAPIERELTTQLTRPLARVLFGRLDARTVATAAAGERIRGYFPGEYEVIPPGADPPHVGAGEGGVGGTVRSDDGDGRAVEILLLAVEERAAVRAFARALRLLGTDLDWHATIWSPVPIAPPAALGRRLRERTRIASAESLPRADALTRADIVVLGSDGARPRPEALAAVVAAGAVPVVSRIAEYEELIAEGRRGLVFEPGDSETLAAHLGRAIVSKELRAALLEAGSDLRAEVAWDAVAGRYEEIYDRLVARRHDGRADLRLGRRLRDRPLIDVDLHMHTDHSYDCATPVEVLLAEAKARGLGAIAVTDHNEISGAHEARAKANGIKVIVAEEVKTADQGEVIGLFIEERIPRGMSLPETIAEIKRQGGLVYVPHPFDRLHSVPDYEHLLSVLGEIDAIEVFNPRVAISEFNEEALRFAAKYRIPAGAGSDAHVPQGLGSVRIRMRDFDGPEEFLQSLREADIIRNPASLLYVQALKFLQTKALPAGARRSARDRRVRRAARKS